MEKEIKKIIELGISLVGLGIFSFKDLILKLLCDLCGIQETETNEQITMFIGLFLIVLGIILYVLDKKNEKVLTVIGLDTVNVTRKLKNSNVINIIDNVKALNIKSSKKIISDYLNDIKKCLTNYSNYNISYFGIAPLPFIALAGNAYRKEKIYAHFEYFQKDDQIKSLNLLPAKLYSKLKLETEKYDNRNVSVVIIETTCNVNELDLQQFKNCNMYRFYIGNPKTNAIVSERQLEEYSEKIANEIYRISKNDSKEIYVLGACQSSLMFEVFRKLNQNRVTNIIVCNYLRTAEFKYNWGIYASGPNVGKYIELEEIDGSSNKEN